MTTQNEKYRNEIKYLCSEREWRILESRLKGLCKMDEHAQDWGGYRVRSLYFDDFANSCYHENENGLDAREKFRLRLYNGVTDSLSLECKQKKRGKTKKDSVSVTLEQYDRILKKDAALGASGGEELFWRFLLKRPGLLPKMIVEYERIPYVYFPGNVRITYDRNISGSARIQDFLKPEIAKRPVTERGWNVLEVKFDEFLPNEIYALMQLGTLRQTAFSKYCICRRVCDDTEGGRL